MPKKKTSWQRERVAWQPSPDDPKIVFLRFPGWMFWPDAPEDEKLMVRVRLLGPKERDGLEAFMLPLDLMGFSAHLISLSLVDGGGNRLFSEKDEADLFYSASTPIFALTHAILEVNGLLPLLDQKVERGEDISAVDFIVDSIVDAIRSKYPSWPQGKIDEFRMYSRLAIPVYSFQRSYQKKYRPESEERDHILPTIPSVPEEERKNALERLLKRHPMPIYYKRWKGVGGDVMRGLARDAKANGVSVEEELKTRLLNSLKAALISARRKTGIFTNKEEFVQKLKRAYRREAEADLRIPKRTDAFFYLKTERFPDESEEVEEPNLAADEGLNSYRAELDLVERIDLLKRFERLSPKDRETIRVLFENGEDRRAAAKALKITEGALNKRLSRMGKKTLNRNLL